MAAFRSRYGADVITKSPVHHARFFGSVGGWTTMKYPQIRAITCACSSAPVQSPWWNVAARVGCDTVNA